MAVAGATAFRVFSLNLFIPASESGSVVIAVPVVPATGAVDYIELMLDALKPQAGADDDGTIGAFPLIIDHRDHDALCPTGLLVCAGLLRTDIVVSLDEEVRAIQDDFADPFELPAIPLPRGVCGRSEGKRLAANPECLGDRLRRLSKLDDEAARPALVLHEFLRAILRDVEAFAFFIPRQDASEQDVFLEAVRVERQNPLAELGQRAE